MSVDWPALRREARAMTERSYAPYSGVLVGAGGVTEDGRLVRGCNVENASYGLTQCAERNGLAGAVVQGKKPVAVALLVDSAVPTPPCGGCRQVLHELLPPGAPVHSRTMSGLEARYTTDALLPAAFARGLLPT